MKGLFGTADAAEFLGVAQSTVTNQCASGAIAARKVGRDYVIAEAELVRYRNEQLGRPGAKPQPWQVVVEIPRRAPSTAYIRKGDIEQDADGDDELRERLDDLHSYRVFDSLDEAAAWAAKYRGHQRIRVQSAVETLVEKFGDDD